MNLSTASMTWLWLAIVLVVLGNFGFAEPIELTLTVILLYLLLTNADKVPQLLAYITPASHAPDYGGGSTSH